MKTNKVRIGTVVGVLALPLIAVLAMVMFFSFSQAANNQAEAVAGGTGMELRAPANAEVGKKFTVSVYGNLTPAEPIAAFYARIFTSGGIKYNGSQDCLAEVKVRPADNSLEICHSFTLPLAPFGNAWSVLTDFSLPADALLVGASAKVELLNVSYTCNTEGTQTIVLTSSVADPDGAQYGATDGAGIPVKTDALGAADTITIDCVPQAVGGLVVDLDGELGDLPLETAQSSGSRAGLLAGTIAGIAALAVTLTGAAWYARRRWLR